MENEDLSLVVTDWGELALIEKLLSDYSMHVSTCHTPMASHAKTLLKRLRPVLINVTNQLQL